MILAGTALVALALAWFQLRSAERGTRRERVYAYQDQFNRMTFRRRSIHYREFWEQNSYADYKANLTRLQKNQLLMLPNLFEEVGALYNRGLLDRNIAAETLGTYTENVWDSGTHFIAGLRDEVDPKAFCEWEEMRLDTPRRKLKVDRKLTRRRAWRKLVRGL